MLLKFKLFKLKYNLKTIIQYNFIKNKNKFYSLLIKFQNKKKSFQFVQSKFVIKLVENFILKK